VYEWKCKEDVFEDRNLINIISDCLKANLPCEYGYDRASGVCYEFKSYLPIQQELLKKGLIMLHQTNLFSIARKDCPPDLLKNWSEGFKWCNQREKEVILNDPRNTPISGWKDGWRDN
jgi:hypothetical protein